MHHRSRLLLIGPLPIDGDQLGGAKVAFKTLVDDLRTLHPGRTGVIDTARRLSGTSRPGRAVLDTATSIRVAWQVLVSGRRFDAWVLNASSNGALTMLPLLTVLSILLRRPVSLRAFGGNLHRRLASTHPLRRRCFDWCARRCHVLALETQELVDAFDGFPNVRRLPNTRPLSAPPRPRQRCRRWLYLGQIRAQKGVDLLLDVAGSLDAGCSLDLYGSAVSAELVALAATLDGVAYRGEANPDQIPSILDRYDALVLPTRWPGEGMPGVIVEAFQSGMPVVSTRWGSIPELVDDGINGLLIDVGADTGSAARAALVRAMQALTGDDALFAGLSLAAADSGQRLDSKHWNGLFFDWCTA